MKDLACKIMKKVDVITEKNRKLYKKRCDMIEAAYREENELISPNMDDKQRLHAPCHGYKIPNIIIELCDFNDDYSEKLFKQGEYLPNPVDEFSFFVGKPQKYNYSRRIFLSGDTMIKMFFDLDLEDKPVKLGFGSFWNEKGTTCCYMYISTFWKSVLDTFIENINEYHQKLKEIKEQEEQKRREEARALKGELKEGLVQVKAKIKHIKAVESRFHDGYDYKLIIEIDNKSTAYGNLPKKLQDAEVGDEFEFSATFTQKEGDNTHGYFKYPKQIKILEKESE